MQITVNGEARMFENAMTINQLVEQLALDSRTIAVERNRAIVSRSHYEKEWIDDGDAIEIVECIGGG